MVDTDLIEWQKFRDNASIKNLTNENVEINLIKLEPNSKFDEHSHDKTEWIFILEGSYSDEKGTYSKGHFVIAEKGSKHSTKTGPDGCKVLVVKQI